MKITSQNSQKTWPNDLRGQSIYSSKWITKPQTNNNIFTNKLLFDSILLI